MRHVARRVKRALSHSRAWGIRLRSQPSVLGSNGTENVMPNAMPASWGLERKRQTAALIEETGATAGSTLIASAL